MQYCLLMHYQEGPEAGLSDEDMEPARAAFARAASSLLNSPRPHVSASDTRLIGPSGVSAGS